MTMVAARELRNDTAGLLRRVAEGEEVTITVRGRPVAQLVPIQPQRGQWMKRAELIELLRTSQADPGLREDLRRLAGDTTDDLGPMW